MVRVGHSRVHVGEVVAQPRVQCRRDQHHGYGLVLGRALRDLAQQRRAGACPIGDDEDVMWIEHVRCLSVGGRIHQAMMRPRARAR